MLLCQIIGNLYHSSWTGSNVRECLIARKPKHSNIGSDRNIADDELPVAKQQFMDAQVGIEGVPVHFRALGNWESGEPNKFGEKSGDDKEKNRKFFQLPISNC